jgi:UDP-N-acetylglucosamine 2-epimerase (non-hydrolysing)
MPHEKKIVVLVLGTRPEAIKMACVYQELKNSDLVRPILISTGQHREMLDQVFTIFGITPDLDLKTMMQGQSLNYIISTVIERLDKVYSELSPDLVLVQGDTSTAFAATMAGFYRKIPIGHIEAGLRTLNKYSPFPEEVNRRLITQLADLHFAPTQSNYDRLLAEGINSENIWLTGNTVIDALDWVVKQVEVKPPKGIISIPENVRNSSKKIILITGHRRENFGEGFDKISKAIATLATQWKDINFIYPVHLNPQVKVPIAKALTGLSNVFLIDPLDYESLVWLLSRCYFVMSDSGGIQEEAPHLGKPVLVFRESTERVEAVTAGVAMLVGSDEHRIVRAANLLLTDSNTYSQMSNAINPFGDGKSSKRIAEIIYRKFSLC